MTKDSIKNNRDGTPFAKAAAEGAALLFNLGTQEQKRERELELEAVTAIHIGGLPNGEEASSSIVISASPRRQRTTHNA